MSYGYRTAFFNLTFEEWDYGTVASEYVSETYCDVFCSWNKFLLANLMHDAILFFTVCVKHWHLVCFSFFDHSVKRLDNHFADTLAGSHDVCWVYRFVCTDQYESLAAVDHGCVSCFICSNGIILDCLVR